jgi:hypothetical protein
MQFVSYFLILLGILDSLFGMFSLIREFTLTHNGVGNLLIQGIVKILIGVWTGNASRSFKLIVETQGSDIENLMGALGELRKLYRLQYWLILIAVVFTAIALVVAMILNPGSVRR